MSTPSVPPTSVGVRYSPSTGMNTKMQAVTMPGLISGSRMRTNAAPGGAPRSWAARSSVKSNFSRLA